MRPRDGMVWTLPKHSVPSGRLNSGLRQRRRLFEADRGFAATVETNSPRLRAVGRSSP